MVIAEKDAWRVGSGAQGPRTKLPEAEVEN